MDTVQRVAKNIGVLLTAQIISYSLGFFSMMYTARYLGPAGFGILTFALAFTGIFAVLSDLGLQTLTVREVARDKSLAPKYVANVSLMKLILVAITFSLIALIINLLGYPEETIKVVYLLALFVILNAFNLMFYSIFQAFEKMEYHGIGQMLNAALILGGVIFAIKHGFSVVGFASLYPIAGVIVLGYCVTGLKLKFLNPSSVATKTIEFDWHFWKLTIKAALPFGLTMVFGTLLFWVDTVMLSLMKGDVAVGWYNAAYRIIILLLFVPIAFNLGVFPAMSSFYKTSQSSLRLAFEKYLKYMIVLGIPIGIGVSLLSSRFILLIFGAEYGPSVVALQVLVWASVFHFIGSPFGRLFEASNKQVLATKISGSCLIFNVILNLIFIPKYSYVGASVTSALTGVSFVVLCLLYSANIGYGIFNRKLVGIVGKVLISSALMGIFIRYFYDLNLAALVILSALLYFVVLYITRGVDKQDITLIRRIVVK